VYIKDKATLVPASGTSWQVNPAIQYEKMVLKTRQYPDGGGPAQGTHAAISTFADVVVLSRLIMALRMKESLNYSF
jgi:hypothetical protein